MDINCRPPSTPIPVIKLARCSWCLISITSTTRKTCSACKRVAYCSQQCQVFHWRAEHKKTCKVLALINKRIGYIPSAGRTFDHFLFDVSFRKAVFNKTESHVHAVVRDYLNDERYCTHCFRVTNQLEPGSKLVLCETCNFATFCSKCPQNHDETTCRHLQGCRDNSMFRFEYSRITNFAASRKSVLTILPIGKYSPKGPPSWAEYQQGFEGTSGQKLTEKLGIPQLADANFRQNFLKMSSIETTIPFTIIGALWRVIPSVPNLKELVLHLIGADYPEMDARPTLEEIFHFLPSLQKLSIIMAGPDVSDTAIYLTKSKPFRNELCHVCSQSGRSMFLQYFSEKYHDLSKMPTYEQPDLVIALNSGHAQSAIDSWAPTIKYLVSKNIPTVFTCYYEDEMTVQLNQLRLLNANFIGEPGENPWRPLWPHPSEPMWSRNYSWYIIGRAKI